MSCHGIDGGTSTCYDLTLAGLEENKKKVIKGNVYTFLRFWLEM